MGVLPTPLSQLHKEKSKKYNFPIIFPRFDDYTHNHHIQIICSNTFNCQGKQTKQENKQEQECVILLYQLMALPILWHRKLHNIQTQQEAQLRRPKTQGVSGGLRLFEGQGRKNKKGTFWTTWGPTSGHSGFSNLMVFCSPNGALKAALPGRSYPLTLASAALKVPLGALVTSPCST